MVCGPIIRQFAEMRSFFELASLGLFDFIFGANRRDCFCGINTGAFGINFPKWRMSLDAFVKTWLSDGRIVDFAVAVTAITNQIDDNVTGKGGAIVCRDLADAHHGVRVLCIDMKNGHVLALGKVRREARGVFLHRPGCETN